MIGIKRETGSDLLDTPSRIHCDCDKVKPFGDGLRASGTWMFARPGGIALGMSSTDDSEYALARDSLE
jgi:hypothetical protein